MKIKLLLILLALFLVVSGITCSKPGESVATPVPTLTNQQVVDIVLIYGVPYLPHYASGRYITGVCNPVGQWAALYEGNDTWAIQGSVVTTGPDGQARYYSTTWHYWHLKERLSLTNIQGPPPTTPATTPKIFDIKIRRPEQN